MKTRERDKETRRPGFTLIELVISVVIIGILASIAVPRFMNVVEKGRTAEARNTLGAIRDAQEAYFLEYDRYTNSLAALGVTVPAACNTSYYYRYSIVVGGGGTTFTARARRCTAGGRPPNFNVAYTMRLTHTGVLSCTQANLL